jgi:hypothetical protein
MKRYIKDGKIKRRNEIVIRKDGMNTYNPTEEMILADGWKEYVTPVYEPTIEDYRKRKKDEIARYDSSDEVNAFYMQGQRMWLDKATRAGLMLRLQAEQSMGKETTTLWYGSHQFELPMANAFQMLYALELYASQCYDNTQRHLAAVDALENKEEIDAYDYRTGYPEELGF